MDKEFNRIYKIVEKVATDNFKRGRRLTLNSFLMWLDWLSRTPKKDWEKQIKVKARQIFMEINE